MIDGDDGTPAAAASALDGAEGDLAVGRGLASADIEHPLESLDDLLGTHQRAGDVRAHLDHVPADRRELEHIVEARHRLAVRRRQLEGLADLAKRLRRKPAAVFLLGKCSVGRMAERLSGYFFATAWMRS